MEQTYTEGKAFNKVDFKESPLTKGEYENCTFINCDFSNSDLIDIKFIECGFTGCNLSLAKLTNTAWREVTFKESKVLGLHFEKCNVFGLSFSFDSCNLSQCHFTRPNLKRLFL
jgi:uncharacterized protein YjbI with pentapeptide repeats